ncbi:MAG TPA: methylated-DNA--[protein]-cysteine S-methyltransferase [Gaiellaceae bacterium]|nr:methylated-DNA--[protein]-cysteine S-methyltransferase [Gaiellaceae bacterium]
MTLPPEVDRRFRDAAAAEGLVDAAYDVVDSPIGPLWIGATSRGLCRISFDADRDPDAELERLAGRFGVKVLRVPSRLDAARRQLDDYFEGRRQTFELEIDLAGVPTFQQEVLRELALVPYAETATYGGLAQRIGRPRAARAVGGALNRNPVPIVLPCHRIVGATGSLVGYAGGLDRKRALLDLEGAGVSWLGGP